MREWLTLPIDPDRAHEISNAVSWHGRSMVLAWGVVAPLAILVARFFKVLPGQDWPRQLDSQFWWKFHWKGQTFVLLLSVFAFAFVLPWDFGRMSLHNWFGYSVLSGLLLQILLGLSRGAKGGPTALAPDGDPRGQHHDMTPWRRAFEFCHKSAGYGVVLLAAATIPLGLWKANASGWMWLALAIWWSALILAFVALQRRGMAVDTYQAIWGSDPDHPGNRMPHPGWGVRRPGDGLKGECDVRYDRGDRVRGH